MYISKDVTPAVARRREVEIKIIKATVKALLAAGFSLSIYDGDEDVLQNNGKGSTNVKAIHDALYNTDEDYLNVWSNGGQHIGWVRFVYGNDGWDVISDYTVNLEPFIGEGTAVDTLIQKYS
jgi:hypothetical protein